MNVSRENEEDDVLGSGFGAITDNRFPSFPADPLLASMTQGDTPSAADADPDTDTVRTRLASVELGGNNGDTSLRDTATAGVASTSSRCSFEISVGEPQKIGDGLSAYTAFRVLTKTNAPLYRAPELTVMRRFKEFLWLQEQLQARYAGVVVPPPPEKSALGRFEEEFVETRRALLERMLQRIVRHPVLQLDADVQAFLESDQLQTINERKRMVKNTSGSGFMSLFGGGDTTVNAALPSGEAEDFFETKRVYFTSLETQLKSLARAVDVVVKQREDLCKSLGSFSDCLDALGKAEINKDLEQAFGSFATAQRSVKEIVDEQLNADQYHLGNTIDEYVRLMGAVKDAYASRLKAYQSHKTAEQSVIKARIALEKSRLKEKKADRLAQDEAAIKDAEQNVIATKNHFDVATTRLRSELERFELEKTEDIVMCLRNYLHAAVDGQRKIITLWETYVGAAR